MTVKSLIEDLSKWIKEGLLQEDSEVYVSESFIPFEDSRLFKASFCGGNEPCFDKNNPTKQALFITELNRVPNFSMKGSTSRYYGDLELKGRISKKKEQRLVDDYDVKCLKRAIREYEKARKLEKNDKARRT